MNGKEDHTMIIKLPWDSDFFRFTIGSCQGKDIGEGATEFKEEFTRGEFDCVYVFCKPEDSVCKQLDIGIYPNVLRVDGHAEYKLRRESWRPGGTSHSCILVDQEEKMQPHVIKELEALSGDLAAVSRFSTDPKFRALAKPMYEIWMDNILKDRNGLVATCMVNDQIAGTIASQLKGSTGIIELVKVSPHFQGKGVGKALVNNAIHLFFEKGVEKISVKTQLNNAPARGLYEKCGFHLADVTRIYHWWKT